ncbi:hypothetical protein BW727_101240 [Jeotgalibaca dankookensis]|uniref:Uncharacterized protein n=1 Tax=Jeotgalibaca dankookensis TaxID=708126 RepID=A0A1S6IPY2_9LACT|nr:hypothetical protein [Jeotgalibaca dankookensis]AQS53607.1 hypothetical protein BW727_101240 [Jeotgalibaca dankookensis]
MDFDDFKSNINAIKSLSGISQKKRATLLFTQMNALEMLLSDEKSTLNCQEIADARNLYGSIDTYRHRLLDEEPNNLDMHLQK